MLTKIVSRKTTSSIFLAIVLVLGIITLMHPSVIVGAQAESDNDNESDNENNLIRMEDNDDESSDDEEEAKDNDDESDNDDNNLNENNNDEIKKVSYVSDNKNYYKSKDSSSSSVFVKKIKCNNINVNLNGVDVDVGLPNNGPVNGPIAEAQAVESNSFERGSGSNSIDEQSDSGTDSRIICINNNNNIVVGEEPPEPETCEECFTTFLTPEQIDLLIEIVQDASSLEEICDLLFSVGAGSEEDFKNGLEILLGVSSDNADALVECLKNVGIEFTERPV